jgi:hypothetical protein
MPSFLLCFTSPRIRAYQRRKKLLKTSDAASFPTVAEFVWVRRLLSNGADGARSVRSMPGGAGCRSLQSASLRSGLQRRSGPGQPFSDEQSWSFNFLDGDRDRGPSTPDVRPFGETSAQDDERRRRHYIPGILMPAMRRAKLTAPCPEVSAGKSGANLSTRQLNSCKHLS